MSNPATDPIRPLVDGQHLSPAEFDLRYEATPSGFRAELVRGVVHVASPSGLHEEDLVTLLRAWLVTYAARHPDIRASSSPTTHLPNGARVEPDALLRRTGAQASTQSVGRGASARLHGAPEFVVEVSVSTLEHDLDDKHGKQAEYRESGVAEYLVVDVNGGHIHWFHLEAGRYVPLPEEEGVIESRVFPGLRLDVEALFTLDASAMLAALNG